MSIELIDKGVSTEDLEADNVEKKEIQEQNFKEKEKKEATDLEKLEAVLSVLVENKVTSIRNCGNKVKDRKLLFNKFRSKFDETSDVQSESRMHKIRTNSSSALAQAQSCKCKCRKNDRGSVISCEPSGYCQHHVFPKYPRTLIEPSHECHRQSFDSYDASLFNNKSSDTAYCEHRTDVDKRLDRKRLSVQKCLPKQLSTEQWLKSTSRQASTETATTSSGYISPTFGIERLHSATCEPEPPHLHYSTNAPSHGDSETIIEMSKIQAQKTLDAIEESSAIDKSLTEPKTLNAINELQHLRVNKVKCSQGCEVLMPQCLSTTCIPSYRYPMVEDQGCYNAAPSRHMHPSGGHYMSCYNSPTHSFQRIQCDDNYLALAMNLEDLEFEQEEERRKRKKRRKKRRKERQIRARGLMADELKSVKKASKMLDPEDLPKRARWTIVATACLLLIMSMLLVGVTLRMAPIIDEMVRKENEEMLHSLSRQGAVKEATATLNVTKTPSLTLGTS